MTLFLLLILVTLPVAAALAAMLFVQYRRFTAIIAELERNQAFERAVFGKRTATFKQETEQMLAERETMLKEQNELTEQKFAMAEANITMLELKEKLTEQTHELERQKLEMAEANLKLYELNEKLEAEQQKSARLLRNILPERVIVELGEKGRSDPELFEEVTVFFSDIVGFTDISRGLDPALLIAELNDIFTEFDHIFVRNRCERIKTIGDAYMSVSGMPVADPEHFANILNSSLEALEYLKKRNSANLRQWQMRMGIHSGKVVGGIVGIEKYIYDVFGDTINTAARMEQNSETMKINVSENTYLLARDRFDFTERSPREVKGKGLMKMYFLNAARAAAAR